MARKAARYAERTTVPIERTHAEIRALLVKAGAEGFMVGEHNGIAQLAFQMGGRQIRFRMPLPRPQDKEARISDAGRRRTEAQALDYVDAESRRKWRALLLSIKAKLESAASGIETFEDAFLAQTVLPGGQTMGEWATEALPRALESGHLPPLLPGPKK